MFRRGAGLRVFLLALWLLALLGLCLVLLWILCFVGRLCLRFGCYVRCVGDLGVGLGWFEWCTIVVVVLACGFVFSVAGLVFWCVLLLVVNSVDLLFVCLLALRGGFMVLCSLVVRLLCCFAY